MTVLREGSIYKNRKPWNNGRITAERWSIKNATKSYYAEFNGHSCADYPIGMKALLYSKYDLSGMNRGAEDWPPRKLSDFLDRPVLEKVPSEYAELLAK